MTSSPVAGAIPVAVGVAAAIALGTYASVHQPTAREISLAGFESAAAWKSAFGSLTAFFFLTQMSLGLRITGRLGPRGEPPPWAAPTHRLIGTLAFAMSIPVVFHCVWALGLQHDNSRVVTHSIVGCVVYGLYVAKVMTVRTENQPDWASPVLGSLLGLAMLTTWWSSALVHYATSGA